MTNKKRCYATIEFMQKLGHDVDLDSNSQGLRVVSRAGNRDLSPRLRPVEMVVWLLGYQTALDEIERRDIIAKIY